MSATAIVILVLFAFLASFIQRVCGFGFGIVFMTVSPFLLPTYGEATALSGMLAILCALTTAISHFKYVPWRKLIGILLTFLVVSFFSVRVVSHVDSHTLRRVLGGVLVLVSLYFIFLNGKFTMRPTVGAQLSMGTLSGVMGGLFAMQGPPAVIYFISSMDSKEEYMAMTQWYFLVGNIMMTFYRAGSGFVTRPVVHGSLVGAIAVAAGLLIGAKVYKRVPVEMLRKIVYIFIGISGIVALLVG